jgi:hypothetical protein
MSREWVKLYERGFPDEDTARGVLGPSVLNAGSIEALR